MIRATSPSNVSSSVPRGRTIEEPLADSDETGFKKYEGTEGKFPRCSARLR